MSSSTLEFKNQSNPSLDGDTIRVLVVDSDEDTSEILGNILSVDSYDIISTQSGAEGVRLVKELMPDVMIVDLALPAVDEISMCKEVRKISNVPILVLSVSNQPGIVTLALDEGADEFLTKPVSSSVLVAHVNRLARRSRAEQNAARGNGKLRM